MPLVKRQAAAQPDRIAIRMVEGGESLTFAALDRRADAVAAWLIDLGLEAGATVALAMENHLACFELWLGIRRAGLYYTPVYTHLTPQDTAYILGDCAARVVVATPGTTGMVREALALLAAGSRGTPLAVAIGAAGEPFASYEACLGDTTRARPLPDRPLGRELFYSSGTTGFPKGIRRPMTPVGQREALPPFETTLRGMFALDTATTYLSVAPLYHATGRFVLRVLEQGGDAVVMKKFDAATALAAIDRFGITHSQWVPTMFVRLLALPPEVRARHRGTTLRCAIHAAAPCPPHVKEAMIDWWGPVIVEYYGGSENVGLTHITTAEWLAHRGSVGRAVVGEIRIVGEDGQELPAGETGTIYFAGGPKFEYLNDPDKTRRAFNEHGWGTYGDMGWVDADGYLYMSDRRTDLILSGGVNIYPQEVENALTLHAAVADAAVIGVPDHAFGEAVKAVVELRPGTSATPALAEELIAWCVARLGKLKSPKSVDFATELPRNPTGKLLRRVLKDRYRDGA